MKDLPPETTLLFFAYHLTNRHFLIDTVHSKWEVNTLSLLVLVVNCIHFTSELIQLSENSK